MCIDISWSSVGGYSFKWASTVTESGAKMISHISRHVSGEWQKTEKPPWSGSGALCPFTGNAMWDPNMTDPISVESSFESPLATSVCVTSSNIWKKSDALIAHTFPRIWFSDFSDWMSSFSGVSVSKASRLGTKWETSRMSSGINLIWHRVLSLKSSNPISQNSEVMSVATTLSCGKPSATTLRASLPKQHPTSTRIPFPAAPKAKTCG